MRRTQPGSTVRSRGPATSLPHYLPRHRVTPTTFDIMMLPGGDISQSTFSQGAETEAGWPCPPGAGAHFVLHCFSPCLCLHCGRT